MPVELLSRDNYTADFGQETQRCLFYDVALRVFSP